MAASKDSALRLLNQELEDLISFTSPETQLFEIDNSLPLNDSVVALAGITPIITPPRTVIQESDQNETLLIDADMQDSMLHDTQGSKTSEQTRTNTLPKALGRVKDTRTWNYQIRLLFEKQDVDRFQRQKQIKKGVGLSMKNSHLKMTVTNSHNAVVTLTSDTKMDAQKTIEYLMTRMKNSQNKISLLIHNHISAILLGPTGKKIQEIRTKTNAAVKVYDQYAPSSDERIITIAGNRHETRAAIAQILEIMAYHKTPATIRRYMPKLETDFQITSPMLWGGQSRKSDYERTTELPQTSQQETPRVAQQRQVTMSATTSRITIRQTTPPPKRKPRIYVFGSSHLMWRNGCNLAERLRNITSVEAIIDIDHGTRYVHMHQQIMKAATKAKEEDIILVELGSNDARDLAQRKTIWRPWQFINDVIQAMKITSAKTILVQPLPSPCYIRNNWCQRFPCIHELKVTTKMKQLHKHNDENMRKQPWIKIMDYSSHLLNARGNAANRKNFESGTIHLTPSRAREFTDDLEDAIIKKLNE